jgi:methionine-rich copper-binding protein CopC
MIAAVAGAAAARRARNRRRPHHLRSRPVVVALLVALSLAAASGAHAHARLVRARPANGSTVAVPPSTVELWFNELLDDEFNDVAVYRAHPDGSPADDASLATGTPRVDDDDRTRLVTPVSALGPGPYVAQYKVLSRDGHSARGRVLFRVGSAEPLPTGAANHEP